MIGFVGNSVLGCRLGRGRREATTCRGRYGVAAVVMNGDVSRREAMKVAGRWLVGSLVGMTSIDTVLAAQKPNTEESVVAICQWDKARTNINYCTRQLRLKKMMKDASVVMEDPLEGIGIMADAVNTFSQLDASVYTPIFIPSDDGVISPEQKIYQVQAFEFYDTAVKQLSDYLQLLPATSVESARAAARKQKLEIKVDE